MTTAPDGIKYAPEALKHLCSRCYAATPCPPTKIETSVVDKCAQCGRVWIGHKVVVTPVSAISSWSRRYRR